MNALITESLLQKDVSYLLPFKRNLLTRIENGWLDWIHKYVVAFGQPPALDRFEKEFAHNFVAATSMDPLKDIFEQVLAEKRNLYVRTEIAKHAQELKDGADPTGIIYKIHEAITATDEGCITSEFWDNGIYFRNPETLLTGISGLDEIIGGIAKGDLVYIGGRPGDGKTTFLIHLIAKWFWQGKKVLVISNEIPYKDMMFKIDAVLANMKISEMRLGKWEPDSKEKLRFLQYLRSIAPGKIITPKGPIRQPASIRGMITQYKPDVIAIDGAYLMSASGTATTEWSELAAVSRELKQIANQENLAIVGVLQATRDSEFRSVSSVGALAGSDAYGQDADTVFLLKAQSIVDGDKEVLLYTSKNRNGAVGSVTFRYDFKEQRIYESHQ